MGVLEIPKHPHIREWKRNMALRCSFRRHGPGWRMAKSTWNDKKDEVKRKRPGRHFLQKKRLGQSAYQLKAGFLSFWTLVHSSKSLRCAARNRTCNLAIRVLSTNHYAVVLYNLRHTYAYIAGFLLKNMFQPDNGLSKMPVEEDLHKLKFAKK